MKLKYLLIYLIFINLIVPLVFSINYYKFEFKNSSGRYVSDVTSSGFLCSDVDCKNQFLGDLWQFESSIKDGTNYDIILPLPTSTEVNSNVKAIFISWNSLNYLHKYSMITPVPQKTGNSYTNPFLLPSNLYIIQPFEKISQCSSPISISVVNNIRENLPVSVTSGAAMSADTKAAFGFQSDIYKGWIRGTEFEQYYEVETTLRLKIYKYDSATSKNIGSPIHEENVVERIYYDDTVDVAFTDWMPPPQTDQFSYYNITVESDVTDPKCSSKINQRASKIMRVWRDDPRNECYSLIDTDGLVFSPVDFANRIPQTGQVVTLTFRKLSNYANDYEPWDPLFTLTPQDTNINLRLTGPENTVITQVLPKNNDGNFKDVSVTWTPLASGSYTLEVTADAATCPVITDTSSDPYIQTIMVFDPPRYDLKFTVKSGGNAVSGANVMIVNPPGQKFTTNLGVATYNLPRGTYDYRIEKSPYTAVTGRVELTQNTNLDITMVSASCPGVNLMTDINNCGSCGNACNFPNAAEFCQSGTCVITACQSNYYNINGLSVDGCEYSCVKSAQTESCLDSGIRDEDCDGQFNCNDSECTANPMCNINSCPADYSDQDGNPVNGCEYTCVKESETEDCSDGRDNNCNGLIDCEEQSCYIGEWWKEVFDFNICTYNCTRTRNSTEICDGLDNDCDGRIDVGTNGNSLKLSFYNDSDRDGYGNERAEIQACTKPIGFVTTFNDCNDKNSAIYPREIDENQLNLCDGIDNDCDGTADDGCVCTLGTNITCEKKTGVCSQLKLKCGSDGVRPVCNYNLIEGYEATEVTCDGIDNDCDERTDELSTCCNPQTNPRRECKVECWDGSEALGYVSCVNHQWTEGCSAACPPQAGAVAINYPANDETYEICKGKIGTMHIDYQGIGQCTYKINQNSPMGITRDTRFTPKIGENRLLVKCGESAQSVFYIKEKECLEIPAVMDPELFIEEGISEDIVDLAKETPAEQEIKYSYDGDETVITNSIVPTEELTDASYYLHIPKCLSEHLDKIDFSQKNYEVIKEDPLIAWHFSNVKDRIDLTYKIKGKIDEDCLKQIRGMPIADLLNIEKPNPIGNMVILGIIIGAVITVFIFLQRFHPDVVKMSEEESEKKGIENARNMWLQRIKQQNFKSPLQVENYMKSVQLDDDTKVWILQRL